MKRAFFDQPALELARALLGKILYHRAPGVDGVERSGRIVETEAYVGMEDAACHARFGPTGRARRMFGPPGFAYVYLIYGMYDCFNIVSGPGEFPAAVLIRALEVDPQLVPHRADGPGKLTRALGITRTHDGADLVAGDVIGVRDGRAPNRIVTTPRIGIDYAGEWVDKPWRFVDADSPALSRRLTPRAKASKHRR